MNKTIAVLLCIFLAGGLMVWHWRQPVSTLVAVAPPEVAPDQPAEAASAIVEISAKADTKALLPLAEQRVAVGWYESKTNMEAPAESNGGNITAPVSQYQHPWELSALAATNTGMALTVAMNLPAGDERNEALAAVCFGVAQSNPPDAIKLAQSLHLDEQPVGPMENLVQQWASSDLDSTLAWTDQQPAGTQRDALMSQVACILSQTDPKEAANLVLNQISPGSSQDEAVMMVLHQWAVQNLAAAAGWVENFPETPLRERALAELEGIARHREALVQQ